MYIENLELEEVRTFARSELKFLHSDQSSKESAAADGEKNGRPIPRLPNVNLLVGDNGSGKTTVLQAIALATLGPAAPEAQLPVRPLVRFRAETSKGKVNLRKSSIVASLRLHEQDGGEGALNSRMEIGRRGELETIRFRGDDEERWSPVFESQNEAFFCVCYGATRRIDAGESLERGAKPKSRFLRGQRTQSIFQDSFGLYPLAWWLPELKATTPGRYSQVVELTNQFLAPTDFRFTGDLRNREYLFERGKTLIPLLSMSDGYRAFVGWVSDLLYHICYGCPSGKKLVESCGIVMVDEIDLHLHPRWQMSVVETVANALPRMQFILTSHSPLVTGSLESMNILTMKVDSSRNETEVKRLQQRVHGLDADQVLITDFFGLKTTRATDKVAVLEILQRKARGGDKQAARELVLAMSRGAEESE